MNTLPTDIIQNHIIPYTYNLHSKSHLFNLRSFVSDFGILENVYLYEYSIIILLNDLQLFINDNIENLFSRLYISHKNNENVFMDYEIMFFKDNANNTYRKVRQIWGLFTPFERTSFINKYIIDKFDI